MTTLKVLGLDPSLRNFGAAACNLTEGSLEVSDTFIAKTTSGKTRQLKQSHKDIQDASYLYTSLVKAFRWADVICIEIPHGSQTSRGGIGNGICYGVIASLLNINDNVIYVSANDVKNVVRLNKEHKPTKQDIIRWVRDKHPEAPLPNTLSAEHICDAIVAIHAAMKTKQFKEYL